MIPPPVADGMLTVDFDDLALELDDGTVKHVGTPTTAAVKLYHVEAASARAFGDRQVKLAFEDGEGNEVEIALDSGDVAALAEDLERHRDGECHGE